MQETIGLSFSEMIFEASRIVFYVLIILGWIVAVYLIAKAYAKRRKRTWVEKQKYITVLMRVPKNNEKGPLSAQLMFASLHGIYKSAKEKLEQGSFQEHISLEIVSTSKFIRFYIYCPVHLKDFIQGQVYAQYPTVEISEVSDYTLEKRGEGVRFAGTELSLIKDEYYPIKTFGNFEVDPLAGITGVLSQVGDGEQIWVQILARPVDDSWQKKAISHVNDIKAGKKKKSTAFTVFSIIGKIFSGIFTIIRLLSTPDALNKGEKIVKLSGPEEQAMKAIEEKSTQLGFESNIRITYLSKKTPEELRLKLQSIAGAFKQYNASNLNGFVNKGVYIDDFEFMNKVQTRHFEGRGFILNIEELASLYHLPTVGVETTTIDWTGSKKGDASAILPIEGEVPSEELTVFGKTNYRDKVANFGIKLEDRRRHMYIIGQTGTGKSTVMKIMALDDIREGRGVAIIDPHGEFVDSIMDYIPESRIKDVVYLNPGDRDFPLGFNLLENVNEHKRELLASSLMSIFKKIWEGVWSARMEYITKNIILALLETPGTTLLSASKMLVNSEYRNMIVDNVKDPVVKEYWLSEFEPSLKTNPKFITEAVAPIQNKIGQFISVPSIRNIVGQSKSTFDLKDIMDSQKILLVKFSKGEIGEDNMALIGAMLITKIYLTIMERAGMKEEDMKDFYLYVDEFQNFATSSFANILSESRKYKLNLIVAHQYVAQLGPEVSDAIFGNASNYLSFRVGSIDAPKLRPVFEPVFNENDLSNLDNYHIYVKMVVDGNITPAFSATTINYTEYLQKNGFSERIIRESRDHYAKPREEVERSILDWGDAYVSDEAKKFAAKVKKSAPGEFSPAVTPGNVDEKGTAEEPMVKYREIKDKNSGVWYVRKKQADKKGEKQIESGGVVAVPVEAKDYLSKEKEREIEDDIGLISFADVRKKEVEQEIEEEKSFEKTIKPGETVEF